MVFREEIVPFLGYLGYLGYLGIVDSTKLNPGGRHVDPNPAPLVRSERGVRIGLSRSRLGGYFPAEALTKPCGGPLCQDRIARKARA